MSETGSGIDAAGPALTLTAVGDPASALDRFEEKASRFPSGETGRL